MKLEDNKRMGLKMIVTLILNRFIETGTIETKTIQVDSLNENLVECIETLVPYKSYIAFNDYYGNCNLMTYQRCYPYIRTNGTIKWIVPYEEVLIKDFIETNNLEPTDPIKVDINNIGGAGDLDFSSIIDWIIAIWPYIKESIDTSASVLTITGVTRKVYKFFANKKKQVPGIEDVKELPV